MSFAAAVVTLSSRTLAQPVRRLAALPLLGALLSCAEPAAPRDSDGLSAATVSALCQMAIPTIYEAEGTPPPLPGEPVVEKNWPRTADETAALKKSLIFVPFSGDTLECTDNPLPGKRAIATREYFNSVYLTQFAIDEVRNVAGVSASSSRGAMAFGGSATCIFERAPGSRQWHLSGCTDYIQR